MSGNSNGKGSTARPLAVDAATWEANWMRTFSGPAGEPEIGNRIGNGSGAATAVPVSGAAPAVADRGAALAPLTADDVGALRQCVQFVADTLATPPLRGRLRTHASWWDMLVLEAGAALVKADRLVAATVAATGGDPRG